MATDMGKVFATLANVKINNLVHGYRCIVRADHLIPDARSRNKVWSGLVRDGYLVDSTPGKVTSATTAVVTDKAFDELQQAAPTPLAGKYTYDPRSDHKTGGVAWVVWDHLDCDQKAAIVRAARVDPSAYAFYAFNRFRPENPIKFALGEGGEAKERKEIGNFYDAVVGVSDASVVAKRYAEARAYYKQLVASKGLTAFLRSSDVIGADEVIPIASDEGPVFGEGRFLSDDPAEWAEDLPRLIKAVKEDVEKNRARLALFEKMAAGVGNYGGWDKFLAAYDDAVERRVSKDFDDPQLPRPGGQGDADDRM